MIGNSLRVLLLRALIVPLAVVMIAATVFDYYVTIRPWLKAYDQGLTDIAVALAEYVRSAPAGTIPVLPPVAERFLEADKYDRIYYQIRHEDLKLVAGNASIPDFGGKLEEGEAVLSDGLVAGQAVRVVTLRMPGERGPVLVQVAETTNKRHRLLAQVLSGVVLPDVILGLAMAGIIWIGIRRGLAPLQGLRRDLEIRSHADLRPLPEAPAPQEIQPLLHAMNGLLQRLRDAGEAQQRFLANAAHQLRTPLAALGAQVELAKRKLQSSDLPAVLQNLECDTQRAAHLANQLLTLARTEPAGISSSRARELDLKAVVEQAVEIWVPRAIQKDIDLGFEASGAGVHADPVLMQELLANLIDNSLRYTPPGGWVTVRTFQENDRAVLQVEDNGIGIPETERERVFERFYRVAGTPSEGSGLGLAIVKEIATAHGGSVEIGSPVGRGTVVTVRFPGVSVSRGALATAEPS